jgi:hypothetical protein
MCVGEFLGMAGVPLIVALTEMIKRVFPEVSPRWYPMIAVMIGMTLNLLGTYVGGAGPVAAVNALLAGLVAGLAAVGLYSGTKALSRSR